MVQAANQTPPSIDRFTSTSPRSGQAPPDRSAAVETHPDTLLANELASELWSRLPLARIADEAGHRSIEQIIRVVTSSHSQIVAWYTELRKFADAICQAAIEFRGGEGSSVGFREQLTLEIKERITGDGLFPLPPRSFVDHNFGNLEPAAAMQRSERELEELCIQLSNQFFALLEQLQQRNLVGAVQFTDSTCRFTFFRRVAILDREATRTEERYTLDPSTENHRHQAEYIDTYQTAKVEIQHRHALHVHHVHNPVLRELGQTTHPLPQKYRQLLDSCPDWIRPSLRVIEGELFREEQVEWDTLSETRPDEQLVSSRWERCPAIVFGDYVLAGWGEQAIAGEENRVCEVQAVEAKQNCLATAKRYQTKTAVMAVLAVALMLFSGWATPALASLAILTGLGVMYMASQAAHYALVACDRFSTSRVLAHTLLIGLSVFAVQATVYSAMHFSLSALAFAILFAAAGWIVFAVKSKDGELDGFRVD